MKLILLIIGLILLMGTASATEIYRDDFTSLSNMSEYNNITLDAKEGTRYGQVINRDNSWEQSISYQSTKLVNGVYEMLYDANSVYDLSGNGANSNICYANSTNGTGFDKPILGLWSFGGNSNNNIFHQNASMDENNHFDFVYVAGDAYPYKLMIGKHTADAGGTWYFDLWKSVNLQTKAVYIKTVTTSTTATPMTLATNGTTWFLYYQDYPSAQNRNVGLWMSNNNSFENSTWADQGNVDTLIALHDQKHFVHSGIPSITKPNEEQCFFWDDMSGTLTSPIGINQLMIGTNNLDWRFRGISVPNMSTTNWGIIPVTSGAFESGWVISSTGFIEDPTNGNYRVYYSGSNTTTANTWEYGGVGMYEWTSQQVTRIRNQDKIIKSTDLGVLPDSDGWTAAGTVSGNSVSNGILTLSDTSTFTGDYYYILTAANDTASERLNVKFRMKVISKSGVGSGITMIARTDSYGTAVRFNTTGIDFVSDTGAQTSKEILFNTTGDFHNYELECSRGNAKFYIDGNLVFTGRTYHAGNPGVTGFYFGSTTSVCLSESQWDWVDYSFGENYNGGNETNANFTSINISIPATGTYNFIENHTANVSYDLLWSNGSILQSGISNGTQISSSASGNNIKLKATITDSSDNDVYYWGVTSADAAPNITSWANNKTSNNTLDFTINTSEEVNFNATANQTITTWNWYKDDVDQSHNYDNITLNWSSTGLKHVVVNATNTNGTSSSITWNVTVQSAVSTSSIIIPANSYGMINNWTIATNFSSIASSESNDVCYTYYNVTTGEWDSYYVGYSWNANYEIPLEASVFVFVDAETTVTATIVTPSSTELYTGWNMIFVEGADNETVSSIIADIGANCSDVWKFNSTAGAYSNTVSDTIQPNQGFLAYITQNMTWTRSDL